MTDEELEQLEQEEHSEALQTLAAIILLIVSASDSLSEKLYRIYNKYGVDGAISWAISNKRLNGQRLRTKIFLDNSNVFDLLFDLGEIEFRTLLEYTIRKEYSKFGIDLTNDQLLSLLDRKWGMDNLNWLERWLNRKDKVLFDLEKSEKQSFIRRDSFSEVESNKDELMDKLKRSVRTLLITEQSAMSSLARQDIFKQLGATKFKYYTRADERTCEECAPMHGMVFPMSAYEVGVTVPPIHSNCRDWIVPIME